MPFTRQFIKNAAKECDVELPKELIDTLINEHLSVRDSYAESRVKEALEENKPADPTPIEESDEYKNLKKEYDDYKVGVENAKTEAKKKDAYRAMLEGLGISKKWANNILRVSDLGEVELDDDGKLKDIDDLKKYAKKEYADYITKDIKTGVKTEIPPNNDDEADDHTSDRAKQVAAQFYERLYGTKAEESK